VVAKELIDEPPLNMPNTSSDRPNMPNSTRDRNQHPYLTKQPEGPLDRASA